jgi:ABC-type sugar transport system ATPase subunit
MIMPLFEIRNVSKAYGATQALDAVSLQIVPGEVHAIVGENGAGKSTLINILSGIVAPDDGELLLERRPVVLATPQEAQRAGIATVHQELSLVDHLSVAENIFASRVPARFGLVQWRRLARDAKAVLGSLGVEMDESARTGDLPVGARQLVEIAKALSLNARLMLFDEPTSALGAHEKEALFDLLGRLKTSGIAVIYITHHLQEVMRIADRVTVLRDGKVVAMRAADSFTPELLVRDMVGRDITPAQSACVELGVTPSLRLEGLSLDGQYSNVSFLLRRGEIVALAGLMGSGRNALAGTLAGLLEPDSGRIYWEGKPLEVRSLREAMRAGIAYVPGERKTEGLFLELSTGENVIAASLPRVTKFGLFNKAAADETTEAYIRSLHIKARGADEKCAALSGGNQQKVLLAKWLETRPRLLIVDEPTKGVDIAAKAEIHQVLRNLADSGASILIVSSDLPEMLTLAHRVLVMHGGRIVADLLARATSEGEITAFASGLMKEAA